MPHVDPARYRHRRIFDRVSFEQEAGRGSRPSKEQWVEEKRREFGKIHWDSKFFPGAYVRTRKIIENPIGDDLPAGVTLDVIGVKRGTNNTAWIVCSNPQYGGWHIRPGDLLVIENKTTQGGRYRILLQKKAIEELDHKEGE